MNFLNHFTHRFSKNISYQSLNFGFIHHKKICVCIYFSKFDLIGKLYNENKNKALKIFTLADKQERFRKKSGKLLVPKIYKFGKFIEYPLKKNFVSFPKYSITKYINFHGKKKRQFQLWENKNNEFLNLLCENENNYGAYGLKPYFELLTQLKKSGITMIAASNQSETLLDAALLRPGRFDTFIKYFPIILKKNQTLFPKDGKVLISSPLQLKFFLHSFDSKTVSFLNENKNNHHSIFAHNPFPITKQISNHFTTRKKSRQFILYSFLFDKKPKNSINILRILSYNQLINHEFSFYNKYQQIFFFKHFGIISFLKNG
nr:hypothetical protein [Trentepohlia sp. YN1242]